MATITMPTAAEKALAEELHKKQLLAGEKMLSAEAKPSKVRVSAVAYRDAERFFQANKLGFGPKPEKVEIEAIKELMAADVLERTGHGRATRYKLWVRPLDLLRDDSLVVKKAAGRPNGRISRTGSSVEHRSSKILQIDNATKAYIRAHVREYLAFATGSEARKHEERRQSENILDVIHNRAKEIVRLSKAGDGPKVTPMAAIAIAQEELAEDFETRLKRQWNPIMFELFGMDEAADTDMRSMRN